MPIRLNRLDFFRSTEERHQASRYISKEINYKVDWLFHLRLTIESQSRH